MAFNREMNTMAEEPLYKYVLANLNLREDKSTASNVITVIPAGSRVEVGQSAI